MSDQEQLIFLILFELPLLAGLIAMIPFYKQVKRDANRYKFYAFRDKLLWLVALKKIKENDFLFKEFYGMANRVVNNTHRFTFSNFIKSIKASLREEETSRKLEDALRNADPEVQEVILGYFEAVILTLRSNSLIFRFLIWSFNLSNFGKSIIRLIKSFVPTTIKDAYYIEKNINSIRAAY